MQRAVQWILQEQISTGGDWQVRCGNVPCGGWAFEFEIVRLLAERHDLTLIVAVDPDATVPDEVRRVVRRVITRQAAPAGWPRRYFVAAER